MAVVFTYRLPIRPMSCRRKHRHGHVNSAASSISLPSDAPAAMPVEALAPPAFSALLTAHLGELCGLCPTLHHDDAVAALAVAQHHKRISSLPESSTVRVFAEQHPSSAKVRRTLFRPAASSLSPITDGKAKLLDEFWQIYVQLGEKGLRFSPLFHSQPDGVRDSFCRGLAKIEEATLKQQLSIWRRWTKFNAGFMPPPLQPWLPTLEATYAFLQDQSVRGPTVARGLFQGMSWWSRHIGVPFPLQDPVVTAWSQIQDNHVAQQAKPLAIGSLFLLCQLAVGPFTPLAAFCSFALMPLVCCLRLAHLQRSPGVHLDGNYLIGLCTRGKARKNGGRPPFQWSGPITVLGYSNVFQHALRVHSNLVQQFPKMDFVVPDIDASPTGISDAATWLPRKLSLPKFIKLLQAVLLRAGANSKEVTAITSYSLRRFMPTLADVCRCPEELALHIGNWTECTGKANRKFQMQHHYADDRVRTAADTKHHLLAMLLQTSRRLGSQSFDWQAIRDANINWHSSMALAPVPAVEEAVAPVPIAEDPCDSSSSSSSSSSSEGEACNEVIQWFRLTSANRNVVHILRKGSLDLHPLCRSSPLANVPVVRGVGITNDHSLCQRCITAAPS